MNFMTFHNGAIICQRNSIDLSNKKKIFGIEFIIAFLNELSSYLTNFLESGDIHKPLILSYYIVTLVDFTKTSRKKIIDFL